MRHASVDHSPLRSFWIGGFECADHQNAFGIRVDLMELTRHDLLLEQDYDAAVALGCLTIREGIRWSRVEVAPYRYDWSAVQRMMDMAADKGLQIVWDICHFGYPDDMTPLHPMFPRRFAAICRAFAEMHRAHAPGVQLVVTPINEVGFISWLGGDARGTVPYGIGIGWEVKYRLMKAYIEGIEALKDVDPGIRILTTEPLVSISGNPHASAHDRKVARDRHEHQFQVLDILSGRMCPELRGRPEYLDMIGLNFYYDNQWVLPEHHVLCWKDAPPHPHWVPLHRLLESVFRRYGRPLVLSETSHPLEDRPLWMDMITAECMTAMNAGVPLWGVCWYPLVDRPDWDHPEKWHAAGIIGPADPHKGRFERVTHAPTAEAFARARASLGQAAGNIPSHPGTEPTRRRGSAPRRKKPGSFLRRMATAALPWGRCQ